MGFLTPRSRAGLLWRVFFAAVLVVGCSAGAVTTAGLLQVSTLVADISVHKGIVSHQLTLPKPGKPQTLLLIGSDHRVGDASFRDSNTDTMLLIRLNSASSTINLLSIPRDLEVDVPGYGTSKINAAYSLGGYGLLIKTIKANVFPGLHVNHIIDTNFTGFSDLVDAIGCVYSDVDHRYYNDSALTDYSSIDIQPGYQKLCGHNQSVHGALPFVRFRHTDSDLVREARQQDFLRWAKQGFPVSKLLSQKNRLLKIFGDHSTLDKTLQSEDGLIELFDLVAFSDGDTINQIAFPTTGAPVIDGADYVVSDSDVEHVAYRRFLRPTPRAKTRPKAKVPAARGKHARGRGAQINTDGLSADPADGLAQAKALSHPGMPVYYPRLIATDSDYCSAVVGNCDDPEEPASEYEFSYPRQYLIPTQNGKKVHAYRMTVDINSTLGQYYGIQGVHWKNPPLLGHASATKVIHGRTLSLYTDDGGHITTVAWHRGEDSYWVSNDLTSDIPNSQMVGIAASMVRYHG